MKKDGKREAAIVLWAVCREVELAAAIERHTPPDPFCVRQVPPHPLRGPVARGIIHNDYLFRYLGHRSDNLQYHTPDGAHFVVDRNDDGQHKWRFRVKRVLFHAPLIAPQLRRHSSGVSRGIGEIVDSKGAVRDLHDRSRRSPGYTRGSQPAGANPITTHASPCNSISIPATEEYETLQLAE